MEKRVTEASALRDFFHEQWAHLQKLVHKHHKVSDDELKNQRQLSDAVEHIVDQVDTRIRGVHNYKKELRRSSAELIHCVQSIVAQIPPAVVMDKNGYANSGSLMNAIFASMGEVEQLVKGSDEVIKFSKEHRNSSEFGRYSPYFYALLFVVREDQQVFGNEIKEDILQKDIAQTAVNFYGHQLVAPSISEQDARLALETILFDSTIVALRSNMVKLRHGHSHQEEIDAALHPEQNINNPEVYLKVLSEQLSMPKSIISVQSNMLRVNKMGIKLSVDSSERSNNFSFNEVGIGRAHSKVISLVKIRYSDWDI
ncbi:MAG: hypothetical protein OEL79_07010 [Chromatiales bacterium]|nr:hypothetical protein [Chromatiales bacterium]